MKEMKIFRMQARQKKTWKILEKRLEICKLDSDVPKSSYEADVGDQKQNQTEILEI